MQSFWVVEDKSVEEGFQFVFKRKVCEGCERERNTPWSR